MSSTPPPIKAPRVAGGMLRLATRLMENRASGAPLSAKLLRDIGISPLRRLEVDEALPFAPPLRPARSAWPEQEAEVSRWLELAASAPRSDREQTFFTDSGALRQALDEGSSTPQALARRSIDWQQQLEARQPPLRILVAQDPRDVMAQAEAAGQRRQAGQVLGPLDGIPVAVKDELDLRGYPTTVGTSFLGEQAAEADAEVVARLRTAGAVLVGKANMHEIGLGVTGVNPHHGACRNPFDPDRVTGGSSSGPAAAVASGLVPIAVGADGGGSIRIPAALCGVVGLKPTFGRMSERGAAPLCWSVAHVGPIAATAADCALAYTLMAGVDEHDPNTRGQPPVHLDGFERQDLAGLRLGIVPAWFDNADEEVVKICRQALDRLQQAGCQLVEIEIGDLELVRPVHLVIIVSEMAAAHQDHYRRHRKSYAHDTRMNLALARRLHAYDYIQAQRLRLRLCGNFQRALEQVDAIVTPTTGCTAPPIRKDALRTGESDLVTTERIMRFAPAANLTGLPAISFPVGADEQGLPVGLQALGRAFEEHLLLRLARVAESLLARPRPRIHRSLLDEAAGRG